MTVSRSPHRRQVRGIVRGLFTLSVAEGIARLLSFGFYLVAARTLAPAGFGEVRYTLAIALMVFGPVQVLCHAATRQLGFTRQDPAETRTALAATAAAALWLLVPVVGIAVMAAQMGLLGRAQPLSLAIVLLGYSVFQVYYSAARGVNQLIRASSVYIGGSLLQLIAVIGLARSESLTPQLALVLFGVSGVVPVMIWEGTKPLFRTAPRLGPVERERLFSFARPLIVAQLAFVVWSNADQVWAEAQFTAAQAGIYAAARNFAQLFMVIPAAITGILIPQVAEYRAAGDSQAAARITKFFLVGGLMASGTLALLIGVFRQPLLVQFYGEPFRGAGAPLVALCWAMTGYLAFATVAGSMLGWGQPRAFAIGIAAAAVAELLLLPVVGETPAGLALVVMVSIAIGVGVVAGVAALVLRRRPPDSPTSAANGKKVEPV